MPGATSDSFKGPRDWTPYVPSWCYPDNRPRMCPCGHHEGFHSDAGTCVLHSDCGCIGLPADCYTPDEDM